VVVGDQGALGRGADLPVEPDRGVESEQALHDARPQPGRDATAVPVQAELVLEVQMIASTAVAASSERPPGRVRRCERDPRCQAPGRPARSGTLGRQSPCRPPAACPVPAGWPGPTQHGHGGLAFVDQFGVGQPEPRHGPVGGGDQQQPAAPVEAVVPGVVAIAGPAGQAERVAVVRERPPTTGCHPAAATARCWLGCGRPASAGQPPSARRWRAAGGCRRAGTAAGGTGARPGRVRPAASGARRCSAAGRGPRPGRSARRR
jgi:hypothetical protein